MRVGSRLKPDARGMTTLPIAALDLVRVLDPSRVGLMDDVKNRVRARELVALRALERRAVELEGTNDPEPFEAAEAEYVRQCEAAAHDAGDELQAIATGGDPRFAEAFASARGLLGPQWPLTALPVVPLAAARSA
jgi:hypothetical protein